MVFCFVFSGGGCVLEYCIFELYSKYSDLLFDLYAMDLNCELS